WKAQRHQWQTRRNLGRRYGSLPSDSCLGLASYLMTGGNPLPDHWSSGNVIVNRLAPDWVRRAEAEILLALFAMQDVTGDQLVDVARSVWGSSSAEALSKVQAVLLVLIDAGRLQEDDRGVFRVKRSPIQEQKT